MKRRQMIYIASASGLVLLVVGILAFLYLDFRAVQSRSDAQHTVSTSTIAQPDQGIVRAHGLVVNIIGVEEDPLCAALRQTLIEQLRSKLASAQVSVAESDLEAGDQPLLRVEVTERIVQWTPFWSTADLSVEIIYASDGKVDWRENTNSLLRTGEPSVHTQGTAQISDQSWGLISRRGYQKHLGEQAAAEIYRMIENPLFNPPG
jgi:hypothetical protein